MAEAPASRPVETASEWVNYDLEIADRVARIAIHHASKGLEEGRPADPHWELYEILERIRFDDSARVVVISGARDGEFQVPLPQAAEGGDPGKHLRQPARQLWKAGTAIVRLHQAMAELDRPIIAKVNGDVLGFGSSIMFSCDLIVAREGVRVCDNHLGMGEIEPFRSRFGVVPGDGGTALLPLFMSPARAKEYLLLAREYRSEELAQLGIINAAVPADELDAKVEAMVAALLRRPAYALAWSKRVANKHVVDQLNRTLDAGIAYELVNMYQVMVEGGQSNLDLE